VTDMRGRDAFVIDLSVPAALLASANMAGLVLEDMVPVYICGFWHARSAAFGAWVLLLTGLVDLSRPRGGVADLVHRVPVDALLN